MGVKTAMDLPSLEYAPDGLWEIYSGVINPKLASVAGNIALSLIRMADRLHCVKFVPKAGEKRGTIWASVGIWDPEEFSASGTIFGNDKLRDYCEPLVTVIGELQVAYPQTRHVNFAYLSRSFPSADIPLHSDPNDARSTYITCLKGESENLLLDKEFGPFYFTQLPGDTYVLHTDSDGMTVPHAVTTSNSPRIALVL